MKTTLLSLFLTVFALQLSWAEAPDSLNQSADTAHAENADGHYCHPASPAPEVPNQQRQYKEEPQPIWKTSLLSNIFPFIFVIIVVIILQIGKFLKRKQMNELALRHIELGKDLPQELFREEKDIKSSLRIGIILSSIGIGLFFMFAIFLDPKMSAIAAVPFFMGLGFILIDKLERNRNNNKIG